MASTLPRALTSANALSAGLTLITAHSGCNGTAPNSREHILQAIESGAEMIEIDVRAQDDLLYLSHDVPASVSACVTLAECFALVAPHAYLRMNCDVKTDDLVGPVMRLAKAQGIADRIVFTGQCNHALEEIYALGADMWHSLWMTAHPEEDMERAREALRHSGCPALNTDYHMATAEQCARLQAAGLGLSVWTVDQEEDLRRFLRMGVFNITTRNPTLALRLRDEIQGTVADRHLPLEAIVQCVYSAGRRLVGVDDPGTIIAKEGEANYVSQWDMETERYLIDSLSALVPGASFLCEESRTDPNPATGVRFIIDPIDGTTNFIHGYRWSSVSVAVLYDGRPLFGAVYNPYSDEMFTALRGAGAYLNGRRIRVSTRPARDAVIAVGTSPYVKHAHHASIIATIDAVLRLASDIRRSGSAAADLCSVACGRAEGFLERSLSPWDYAAGVLLIREAGGIASTFAGELPSFSSAESIVCANRVLYTALRDIGERS